MQLNEILFYKHCFAGISNLSTCLQSQGKQLCALTIDLLHWLQLIFVLHFSLVLKAVSFKVCPLQVHHRHESVHEGVIHVLIWCISCIIIVIMLLVRRCSLTTPVMYSNCISIRKNNIDLCFCWAEYTNIPSYLCFPASFLLKTSWISAPEQDILIWRKLIKFSWTILKALETQQHIWFWGPGKRRTIIEALRQS